MPFVSEELWGRIDEGRAGTLITAPWPVLDESIGDPDAAQEMDWVVRLVTAVRAVRAEMNVPAGARIALGLRGAGPETEARLGRHRDVVARLARLSEAELLDGEVPSGSVQMMLDEATIVLPLAGVIEFDKERARLDRELGKVGKERDKLERKLDNQQFLSPGRRRTWSRSSAAGWTRRAGRRPGSRRRWSVSRRRNGVLTSPGRCSRLDRSPRGRVSRAPAGPA